MENTYPQNTADSPETQEETAIEATLDYIQYAGQGNAFFVGRFTSSEGERFTAAGEMIAPSVGDDYILNGRWAVHPKYGRQFRIESYEIMYPVTRDGIERYLGSGLIRGIGKITAKRIVRTFGEKTIDIMNTNIERLLEVEGIGKKTYERIRESWEEQRALQRVMLFLKSHGISTGYAIRIFKSYGADAIDKITHQPYGLVDDVDGIGFVAADKIALELGIEPASMQRLQAGLVFVLREAARSQGHVFLTREECVNAAAPLLQADGLQILEALNYAAESARVVFDGDCVYVPDLFYAEHAVAERLFALTEGKKIPVERMEMLDRISDVERESGKEFTPHQAEAIMKSISGDVTVITGGPGTGKTTAMLGTIELAREMEWNIAVCAPTGRAAKRLTEVTGFEAKTIHRMLEFDPRAMVFLRNAERPLDADIVIVDEMSMVDVRLMAWLLDAIPAHARLVLVGDADQLPSVGPGNVLRDIIESTMLDTVQLSFVFRQAADSSIISNAHRVNAGEMPVFGKETFFIEKNTPESIAESIREIVVERIPRELDYDPLEDIQVLAPMHHTVAGVRNLNSILKAALNPYGERVVQRGQRVWNVGDKVMQITNNYDKDVYNGDIGFITGYDDVEGAASIVFDTGERIYGFEDMDQLVHAYAITIHKSQGSEYDVVVIPATMQHRIMLQRNLIYTAMTRARKMLVFVGQKSALALAVRSTRTVHRNTQLLRRLHDNFPR